MIFIIIFKILFFLSLAALLVIVVRKIPALSRLPEKSGGQEISLKSIFSEIKKAPKNLGSNIIPQTRLEKFLRRLKIFTLKISNVLDKLLKKTKKKDKERKV